MTKKQTIVLTLVAVVAVLGTYVHGRITDRWSHEVTQRLANFTARLDGVPSEFGDWVSQDIPLNAEEFKASNCQGAVQRAYKNTVTDQVITVFLVSGKGYHVTIHTPEQCYVGAGYTMDDDPRNFKVKISGIQKFWIRLK